MIWDFVADYLSGKGLRPIAKQINKVNFHLKIEGDTITICTLVKMLDGWNVELEMLRDNVVQMERKFYLSGYKHVNFMHIVFTDDFDRDKILAESELQCWIVDMTSNRLIIYENQPADYLNIREKLEDALEAGTRRERIGFADIPVVSIVLIAINVIVFLMLESIDSTENSIFMLKHGAANWELIFNSGEYYRLFTSMFLHFGLTHLLSNMFMLVVIGSSLEKIIGKWNYLLIYIVSGLVGSMSSSLYYMVNNKVAICAGASGAIFGLLGALIGVIIKNRKKAGSFIGFRLIVLVAIIAFGNVTTEGIDFTAHIAGLVSGLIMGLISYNPYSLKIRHIKGD